MQQVLRLGSGACGAPCPSSKLPLLTVQEARGPAGTGQGPILQLFLDRDLSQAAV